MARRKQLRVAAATLASTMPCGAFAGDACDTWMDYDGGLAGGVLSLGVHAGQLIAGGSFPFDNNGVILNGIARWNGVEWQPYDVNGSVGVFGGPSPLVLALSQYGDDLVAAGDFTFAGGVPVNRIARWDGTLGTWVRFGSGMNLVVDAVAVFQGDLYAGGAFGSAGGQNVFYIARWDGVAWSSLAGGMDARVQTLIVHDGHLVAGGEFAMAGGQTVNRIARWDGGGWHAFDDDGNIGLGAGSVRSLTVYGGDLVVGGGFSTAGGKTVNGIARWDGSTWHAFDDGGNIGVNSTVYALAAYGDDLVAGGSFAVAGGRTVNFIARWDGTRWWPFDVDGNIGMNSWTYALTVHDDQLVAGGIFTIASGQTVNRVAAWRDCPGTGPADLDGNGVVDIVDLILLLGDWGCEGPDCIGDVNGDGVVDVVDLIEMLGAWG